MDELADYGNLLRIYLHSVLSLIFPIGTFLCWLANMLNFGISSVLWALFSIETPVRAKNTGMTNRRSTEFASQRVRIRRSRKYRDRCWTAIGHKNIFLANERQGFEWVWNWLVKSSIPGALSFALVNFYSHRFRPVDFFPTRISTPGSARMGMWRFWPLL